MKRRLPAKIPRMLFAFHAAFLAELAVLAGLPGALWAAGAGASPGGQAAFDVPCRMAAIALLEEDSASTAADAFKAIIATDGRFAFDRINMALALLRKPDLAGAQQALDAARAIDDGSAALHALQGLVYRQQRLYEKAIPEMERAVQIDPACVEALFGLAVVHMALQQKPETLSTLERLSRTAREDGRVSPSVRPKALYLAYKFLSQQAIMAGREDDADRYHDLCDRVELASPPQDRDLDTGPGTGPITPWSPDARRELAREGITSPPIPAAPALVLERRAWPLAGPVPTSSCAVLAWTSAGPDLFALGQGDRLVTARRTAAGLVAGPDLGKGHVLACADLLGNGSPAAVVRTPTGALSILPAPGTTAPAVALAGVTEATAALATDFDADGDLDLVVAGRRDGTPGVWVYRNETAPAPGSPLSLKLVSSDVVGLSTATKDVPCGLASGDLDDDGDTDVVAFTQGSPPVVYVNRRQGHFTPVALEGPPATGPGCVADLDGDGHLDVAYPCASGIAVAWGEGLTAASGAAGSGVAAGGAPAGGAPAGGGASSGVGPAPSPAVSPAVSPGPPSGVPGTVDALPHAGLRLGAAAVAVPLTGAVSVQADDLDGGGLPALIARTDQHALAIATNRSTPGLPSFAMLSPPPPVKATADPVIADLDGTGALSLLVPGDGILDNKSAAGAGWIRLTLRGTGGKCPRDGVGSRITMRVGSRLIVREARHPAELLGLAGAGRADLLRVGWTDATLQNVIAPASTPLCQRTTILAGKSLLMDQKAGLGGSCPYLYAYRPDGLRFVTDVLAGSPLGLPAASGGRVPGVARELVCLPRDAWAPVDGAYAFRVTEEYREVTYLDQARLWIVDHDPAITVVADEGIGPPSKGAPALLALESVRPVRRAVFSIEDAGGLASVAERDATPARDAAVAGGLPPAPIAGREVTALVDALDGRFFEPPRSAIQGVAPAYTLTLDLPPMTPGRRQFLVMDGCVYWTDAGINTRLAQSSPGALYPPVLEVPDGRGGWREAIGMVRFPAGRQKTSVTQITGLVDPSSPRVRLRTTMRLYIDRIALGESPVGAWPPAERYAVRQIAPDDARVVAHGFRRLLPDADTPPWTIDAAQPLDPLEAAWVAPRGPYTRLGPVTPLLTQFDDRYVILGPGDGVDIRFPVPRGASGSQAAPPGQVRDLALELAGYDKDAHPATTFSGTVAPLPYRGMPAFEPGVAWPAKVQRRLWAALAPWTTRRR